MFTNSSYEELKTLVFTLFIAKLFRWEESPKQYHFVLLNLVNRSWLGTPGFLKMPVNQKNIIFLIKHRARSKLGSLHLTLVIKRLPKSQDIHINSQSIQVLFRFSNLSIAIITGRIRLDIYYLSLFATIFVKSI